MKNQKFSHLDSRSRVAAAATTPGMRLKIARVEVRKKQDDIGEALGITGAGVSAWENGRSTISKGMAIAIESEFGISSQWVLHGEYPMLIETQAPKGRQVYPVTSLPIFNGRPTVDENGRVLSDAPEWEKLPFRRLILELKLKQCGFGTLDHLCMVRVPPDEGMRPMIVTGSLILVNTALELRRNPVDGDVYLITREGFETPPWFRRIIPYFNDDSSCLLVMPEQPAMDPQMLDLLGRDPASVILGKALW